MVLGVFGALQLRRAHGGGLPVCEGWLPGAPSCKADTEPSVGRGALCGKAAEAKCAKLSRDFRLDTSAVLLLSPA